MPRKKFRIVPQNRHAGRNLVLDTLPWRILARPQLEIFQAIIRAHTVLVMDYLAGQKLAAKVPFHHMPMLGIIIVAVNFDLDIATLGLAAIGPSRRSMPAFGSAVTFASSGITRQPLAFPTLRASELDQVLGTHIRRLASIRTEPAPTGCRIKNLERRAACLTWAHEGLPSQASTLTSVNACWHLSLSWLSCFRQHARDFLI